MIKLLAMDVDGTLTDGRVSIDGKGNEYKRFDIQDGMGIVMFKKAGGVVALISGRYSAATERRAIELNVDFLVNGCGEKLPILRALAERLGVTKDEVAYAGDDVNDIECVKWSAWGVAVNNAVPALKTAADYVTTREGGKGAIRELVELILQESK